MKKHQRTNFDLARDELMSQIHRCGVLKAAKEQQDHWLDDTVDYLSERFAGLTETQLADLHAIGQRFCRPVIPHGQETGTADDKTDSGPGEIAGAA